MTLSKTKVINQILSLIKSLHLNQLIILMIPFQFPIKNQCLNRVIAKIHLKLLSRNKCSNQIFMKKKRILCKRKILPPPPQKMRRYNQSMWSQSIKNSKVVRLMETTTMIPRVNRLKFLR